MKSYVKLSFFVVGSESRIGKFLQEELSLSKQKYVGFLHTVCLQAAYDVSADQLYHQISKLRDSLLITEDDYIAVWSWMAHRMRVEAAQIGTSRSTIPLWQQLEIIFNQIHRSISIEGRKGQVSIALDDDKVSFHVFFSFYFWSFEILN